MKLFIYDHCPYCVKARMIFGLKNQPVENIVLLNDDETTPIAMIGQKMLPILETPERTFMPESLDIIQYIDEKFPPQIVLMEEDSFLIKILTELRLSYYSLTMPRWPQSSMEEFKTSSAQQYFQNKKEKIIGPFSSALEKTEEFKKAAYQILERITEKVSKPDRWYLGQALSLNDFHLFAVLRALTIVKDMPFPESLEQYMKICSQKTKIPLNTDIAVA